MRRAWHRPFAVVTALIVGLVALSLYGCGGASQDVDPQAVLASSAAAMQQIKGFHFVYEVHKPANSKPSTGLEIARITGDVNSEGSMQAAIDVTQGGIPLTLNFVQVGRHPVPAARTVADDPHGVEPDRQAQSGGRHDPDPPADHRGEVRGRGY